MCVKVFFCVGPVWIVIGYFLFEKRPFNRLLKVIGIQILMSHLYTIYISEGKNIKVYIKLPFC